MASKDNKVPENIEGKYYVDADCIACSTCLAEAPKNFDMNNDRTYALVCRQPADEEEEKACQGAKMTCPVDAIGDDGA